MSFGQPSGRPGNPSRRLRTIFERLKGQLKQRLRQKLGLRQPKLSRGRRASSAPPNLGEVGQFRSPPPAYQGLLPGVGRDSQDQGQVRNLEDLPQVQEPGQRLDLEPPSPQKSAPGDSSEEDSP